MSQPLRLVKCDELETGSEAVGVPAKSVDIVAPKQITKPAASLHRSSRSIPTLAAVRKVEADRARLSDAINPETLEAWKLRKRNLAWMAHFLRTPVSPNVGPIVGPNHLRDYSIMIRCMEELASTVVADQASQSTSQPQTSQDLIERSPLSLQQDRWDVVSRLGATWEFSRFVQRPTKSLNEGESLQFELSLQVGELIIQRDGLLDEEGNLLNAEQLSSWPILDQCLVWSDLVCLLRLVDDPERLASEIAIVRRGLDLLSVPSAD
jgi:hypothetical protein